MSPLAVLDRPPLDEDPSGPRTPTVTTRPVVYDAPEPNPFIQAIKTLWLGITGLLTASAGQQVKCPHCKAPEEFSRATPIIGTWDAPLIYTCTICSHNWLEPSYFWRYDA